MNRNPNPQVRDLIQCVWRTLRVRTNPEDGIPRQIDREGIHAICDELTCRYLPALRRFADRMHDIPQKPPPEHRIEASINIRTDRPLSDTLAEMEARADEELGE